MKPRAWAGLLLVVCFAGAGFAQNATQVAAGAAPAVVTVKAYDAAGKPGASGLGYIVDRSGSVVTRYGLLAGAASAKVQLAGGQTVDVAGVLNADPNRDLVVLRLPAGNYPALAIADGDKLKTDKIVTIGGGAPAAGQITAIREAAEVPAWTPKQQASLKLLQLSTPVAAGGAVLNLNGELAGIATSGSEATRGNFALHSAYVNVLLTPTPARPFSQMALAVPDGTYTGSWTNGGRAGILALTLFHQGAALKGKLVITNTFIKYKGDILSITVTDPTPGAMKIAFSGDNSPISGTANIQGEAFNGAYAYKTVFKTDRGTWTLHK